MIYFPRHVLSHSLLVESFPPLRKNKRFSPYTRKEKYASVLGFPKLSIYLHQYIRADLGSPINT